MGSGLIISESQPTEIINRYSWLKPMPDGSIECSEPDDGGWTKIYIIRLFGHTHPEIDHVPDIVTLLDSGVTGQKTIGDYKFTFNRGVLTGFESA